MLLIKINPEYNHNKLKKKTGLRYAYEQSQVELFNIFSFGARRVTSFCIRRVCAPRPKDSRSCDDNYWPGAQRTFPNVSPVPSGDSVATPAVHDFLRRSMVCRDLFSRDDGCESFDLRVVVCGTRATRDSRVLIEIRGCVDGTEFTIM